MFADDSLTGHVTPSIRGRITMSAVDAATSPMCSRSNEAGSDCTQGRPQPLLSEETDADVRAGGVVEPTSPPRQFQRRWALTSLEGHQIIQVALLAVIASFVVTTVPGVRAHQGSSWWMNGIPQSLAYGAAAALCLMRTPPSSSDRMVSRFLAVGVMSFGLANVDHYESLVRTLDPLPVASAMRRAVGASSTSVSSSPWFC